MKKKTTKKATKKAVKKVTKKVAKKATPTMKATVSDDSATMLGKMVPDITLKNSRDENVSLRSLKGKKVVIFFYPKDNTPGCTIEANEFNALYPQFKKAGIEVFGLSRDSVSSHDKFRCKFDFGYELLADTDEKVCKAFDVIKLKNMYGKMVLGVQRSTFIIDESGKIAAEFRKVKPEGHAQEMLSAAKNI